MKAIFKRLSQLERTLAPVERSEAEIVAEGILRRMAEERGEPYPGEPIDYTGCHTIADMILADFRRPQRDEAKNAGQRTTTSGGVGT
jgi:hypothetical protein